MNKLFAKKGVPLLKLTMERNVYLLQMKHRDNRQSVPFLEAMTEALNEVEHHYLSSKEKHLPKALVTVGLDKFYSNGLDFDSLLAGGTHEANQFFKHHYHPFLSKLLTFPMPTIACINGHAFAGGVFLALSHDFRGMRTGRGYLCLNEIELPIPIPGGLLNFLRHKITNHNTLRDAALFGKRYTAEEALKKGLVDFTASEENLLEETLNFAEHLPELKSAKVYHQMKKDLYEPIISGLKKEKDVDIFIGMKH